LTVSRGGGADARAAELASVIAEIWASGLMTLKAIAAELNARGVRIPRGPGQWLPAQVLRVLARL
jgi:hypothetical protein